MKIQATLPKKDITGKKFGKLLVIKFVGFKENKSGRRYATWECKCDCGTVKNIKGESIKSGATISCGCLMKDVYKNLGSLMRHLNRKELGRAAKYTVFNSYKQNARIKGYEFLLTFEEVIYLCEKNCYYCGRKPHKILHRRNMNGSFIYNGIDRIDNNTGYIKENCVTCCEICNKAKRDIPYNIFMDWINDLINFRSSNECKDNLGNA